MVDYVRIPIPGRGARRYADVPEQHEDQMRKSPPRFSPFLEELILLLSKGRPKWDYVGKTGGYNTVSEYYSARIYENGEELGKVCTAHFRGADAYEVYSSRRIKAITRTKDPKRAAKVIYDTFRPETSQEVASAMRRRVDEYVQRAIRQANHEINFALNRHREHLHSYLADNWDAVSAYMTAAAGTSVRIDDFPSLYRESQTSATMSIRMQGSADVAYITARGGGYLVSTTIVGKEMVGIFSEVPDRYKVNFGLLRLLDGDTNTIIDKVGVRLSGGTYFVFSREEDNGANE